MDSIKKGQTGVKSRKRYDKIFIDQVLKELEEGRSRAYLCDQYGIFPATLKGWLSKYDLQHSRPGKRRHFTAFEKRRVVQAVLDCKMSITQAAIAYGIKDTGLVWVWVNQSKLQNAELCSMKQQDMKKKPVVQSADEIKSLEQALEDARLKIVALNMLIDVAEEQFKIDIRKKPGAKQSPK